MENSPYWQKIILIDDDILLNMIHKKILEILKFNGEVLDFNNGFQAINHIQKEVQFKTDFYLTPTLIILDLEMPVLNGLGFLKSFGALDPRGINHYKIIVSSNTTNISYIDHALDFDTVEEYIPKPLTVDIFERLIRGGKI
ncbi:response regulator [soil metagenome]